VELRMTLATGAISADATPCIARHATKVRQRAGQRAADGSGDKDQQPRRQHAPAPQALTEGRTSHETDGKAQLVGTDGPLRRLDRRMQIVAQRR
jgi:hypothetical protein